MQTCLTAWARLKNQQLNCQEALKLLVDSSEIINQALLDKEVCF